MIVFKNKLIQLPYHASKNCAKITMQIIKNYSTDKTITELDIKNQKKVSKRKQNQEVKELTEREAKIKRFNRGISFTYIDFVKENRSLFLKWYLKRTQKKVLRQKYILDSHDISNDTPKKKSKEEIQEIIELNTFGISWILEEIIIEDEKLKLKIEQNKLKELKKEINENEQKNGKPDDN
jgi:hypothetical protein